jgi:hypothetical protein
MRKSELNDEEIFQACRNKNQLKSDYGFSYQKSFQNEFCFGGFSHHHKFAFNSEIVSNFPSDRKSQNVKKMKFERMLNALQMKYFWKVFQFNTVRCIFWFYSKVWKKFNSFMSGFNERENLRIRLKIIVRNPVKFECFNASSWRRNHRRAWVVKMLNDKLSTLQIYRPPSSSSLNETTANFNIFL